LKGLDVVIVEGRKAQKELGFHSRNIEETMRDTLDWFKENRYIK
jgi:nucleoside-diphosphate-sugar epimerase